MSISPEILARQLARETHARQQAETLLEQKSLALFHQARQREQALAELRESEERYRLIVELSPDAILIAVDEAIVFANSAARLLFSETTANGLLGKNLLALTAEQDRSKAYQELQRVASGERCIETEELAMRLDGSTFSVSVQRVALTYQGKHAAQMVARDISARKQLEHQLAHQASHDILTGVPNRQRLTDILEQALRYADRYATPVWVGFIDLDRFKFINDHYGHHVGDHVLRTVTERVRSVLRNDDTIGRFGGDEFVVLLHGAQHEQLNAAIVERIMDAINLPIVFDGHHLRITCSLGLATYPDDGENSQSLIEHADVAMYRAKESGRHLCQFYTAQMNQQFVERNQLESTLYTVLDRNELQLHYQPIVNLHSGHIVGVEALLRWDHPELGWIAPDRFIPIAEECGMITKIGAWVLQQACMQCAQWNAAGLGPLRVSVNLSVRQLDSPDLVANIAAALKQTGLSPSLLEIELTETLMMTDIDRALHLLQTLRKMGVRVAVDDFGTGYSSFAYLKRLLLDSLKIDQSFIRGLENDLENQAIVRTMIQLAHNLKLHVIAEGVETDFQLAFLKQWGCDEFQGYLLSQPQHSDGTGALLSKHQSSLLIT